MNRPYNSLRICSFISLLLSPAGDPFAQGIQVEGMGEIRGVVSVTKQELGAAHQIHSLLNRYVTDPSGNIAASIRRDSKPYALGETAAIFLESDEISSPHYPVPKEHAVLDQRGIRFHPQVLAILIGTTVDFPNDDNLFHNVFSYSPPGEFDLGRYPMGDSRSVTFTRPGTVRVYCDIHSEMNATILVLRNPYFAIPDSDGNFSIGNVPPGKYTLNLYYVREIVLQRSITVKAGETFRITLVH